MYITVMNYIVLFLINAKFQLSTYITFIIIIHEQLIDAMRNIPENIAKILNIHCPLLQL